MKHYIEYSKEAYADKIFVSHNKQKITFSEFYYNICSKSRSLKNLNLSDQSLVGILLSNPIDIIEIYFSCLQLDIAPLIFPSDISEFELKKIIKKYKINFIITEWLQKQQIKSIQIPLPDLVEQEKLVVKLDKCFESIDKARANVEKNLQNAKDLFQSQLNQIFSQQGDGWVEGRLEDVCKYEKVRNEN